jgi:hypothetical protein
MNPRLGLILLFEGDHRKVNVTVKNVTTFTAISAVLKQGDQDVSSTYINSTIDTLGNMILTDDIGEKASLPAGDYRYYVTGSYGGKTTTWYWDVLVLPKDDTFLHDFPLEDYDPLVDELTRYEGDIIFVDLTLPGLAISAVAGVLKLDSSDVTSTYCSSSPSAAGDTVTSHGIGAALTIPAGDYAYFFTSTYNNGQGKATHFYRIKVLAKQSII